MVRFYIKERDKTVFLSPSSSSSFCRRRRLSLSVWQNAKRRASLRTGCDEPMRCIQLRRLVVTPARFGWCKGRRASSSRSSVRRRRRRDEDKRWERFRPKIVSLFGFLPKTRSQKSSQTKKKRKFQKKKKERKRRKPSFLKKERMILIVADVVVEIFFFTPRYFTHSLRKRSHSMNCKA